MKDYKDLICKKCVTEEVAEPVTKNDVLELLDDALDIVDSPTEEALVELLTSLVSFNSIDEKNYDALFDAIEEIIENETEEPERDLGDGFHGNTENEKELTEEAQKPLYKRGNKYVKCPNGRIRLRGHCGKPVDKKKARKMRLAHKKHKQAYKKGLRQTKRTKKRLGQIKR